MNSWRFDFQFVAGIAAEELACDADHPASDSMTRGGVGLKLEDQEVHSAASWISGGEGIALELEYYLCTR
jgi:hypothetical protein